MPFDLRCLHLAFALTVAVVALAAGLARPAAAQPVQRLETAFERDVNRYRWVALGRLAQQFGRWDVDLTNRFTSDAYVLFDDRLSFRDEDRLGWQASRDLSARFSAQFHGRAAWFSLSRVFSQELYGGLRYAPTASGWVEPILGFAWDQRPGVGEEAGTIPLRMDAGPAYGLRFALRPPPLEGYVLRLQGDGAWQVINPRRSRAVHVDGSAERTFESTRLLAQLDAASYRRDAYQAVSFLNRGTPTGRLSETVEATTSDTLQAALLLDTPVYRALRLSSRLDLSANDRRIRTLRAPDDVLFFDTDFQRRTFDAEAALRYEQRRFQATLVAHGGAETERRQLVNREALPPTQAAQKSNLLQQADYDQGYVMLQAHTRAELGRTVLTFDGSSSILRHDTPETNPDDRDELYHNGQLGLLVLLGRYVQADVQVFGTYYHTVYLNAERSAENNVQRSLRFRPSLTWTPAPSTEIRFASTIRATYTVDDFVLPGRRPADQSARELRYDLGLRQDFGAGLRLLFDGSLSDLRLGRLLWDDFAEIPFDTLQTYSGWLHVQAGRRVIADVGFRFFIRTDFNRLATVRYPLVDETGAPLLDAEGTPLRASISRPGRDWIEQVGPTCALTWPLYNASAIRLEGWLNIQRVRQQLFGELPEKSAPQIRRAARRGTTQIVPNLSLSVVWNL